MMLSKLEMVKNTLNRNLICGQNYVRTLAAVGSDRNKVLQWFKEFCAILTEVINLIGAYNKETKENIKSPKQGTLLLYLTQLLTCLSLLINILTREEELNLILIEARNCIVKQVVCCLGGIEITLNSGAVIIDPSGSFVKWMDEALDKISEIDTQADETVAIQTCEEAQVLFEEVLSHAMSIAQVALAEDTNMIKGSCQAVLNALNSLTSKLNNTPPNVAMVNLFIDTCSDKLCMLERRVNTGVLKLCLKTFSHFTLPLQQIHDFCSDQKNKGRLDDLDTLVVEFDLHVDRIMQIGLFAVSCSSDLKRGIKIRSCLASLEALESELVPVLTSVLLSNSVHNENCATLLMAHWLNQAFSLQQLIYLIIDPFAFCQIVYDEAVIIVDHLSDIVKGKKVLLKQTEVSNLVSIAKVLREFLNKAQTEFSTSEANKIKSKLNDFHNVLEEVERASKLLLTTDKICAENCTRVLKRCKILLTVLKRLWHCFTDDMVHKDKHKSVENPEAEIALKITNLHVEPTGNGFLDHIINRGKQLLEDRSVMYRSPMKSAPFTTEKSAGTTAKYDQKEIPLSRLVHLRKLSFINASAKSENTLDLQLTDILGDMTALSTNFNH